MFDTSYHFKKRGDYKDHINGKNIKVSVYTFKTPAKQKYIVRLEEFFSEYFHNKQKWNQSWPIEQ